MNGIVAYSRPRGIFGRYVFTVVLNYEAGLNETSEIEVRRIEPGTNRQITYSCGYCGKWATITTYTDRITTLNASEHTIRGTLEFFRYDNVEPGDWILITMRDPDLLFYQTTSFSIGQDRIDQHNNVYRTRANNALTGTFPATLYDITLINWDYHVGECLRENRSFRVDEDLIQKTMNAEPIEIKELLLTPAKQPLTLEAGHSSYIEGELRYL